MRILPETSTLVNAGGGLDGQSRITSRPGRLLRVYPESGKAAVMLESGDQRFLDHVPIAIPPWPTMPPGTPVIVDYLRGKPWNPVVVAALPPGIRELATATKPPYYEPGLDLTNSRVWEIMHELGGEQTADLRKIYPRLVSWCRMTRDGRFLFKHLQELPNPFDGLGAGAPQLHKKVFYCDLGANHALELGWPFASASKIAKVIHSVDSQGTFQLSVGTDAPGDKPVIVSLGAATKQVHLVADALTLDYDPTKGGQLVVTNDEARLVLAPSQLEFSCAGLTLEFVAGKLTVKSSGNVTLEAPKATVKATEIVLDSRKILMGKKNRKVAFLGAKVAYHRHTYYYNGQQVNTGWTQPTIVEGASEVKV